MREHEKHTHRFALLVEMESKKSQSKVKRVSLQLMAYAVPRYPLVTTALPGPRVVQVRLYFMSCWVWMS